MSRNFKTKSEAREFFQKRCDELSAKIRKLYDDQMKYGPSSDRRNLIELIENTHFINYTILLAADGKEAQAIQ